MASRVISNVAEQLIPENRLRKSLTVGNEDAALYVYLKQEEPGNTTVSATDHDHRIGPGGAVALNSLLDGEKAIRGRWTCIGSNVNLTISIFETEDLKR